MTAGAFVQLFEGETTAVQVKPVAPARPAPSIAPVSTVPAPVVALPMRGLAASPSQTSGGLAYSYATHAGTRLTRNADSLFVSRSPAIFAIADGVGDGPSALEAARLATSSLSDITDDADADTLANRIRGKFGLVHNMLANRSRDTAMAGPAASVVAAAISGASFSLVWAGDARAYLLHCGTMRALTRDHVTIGLRKTLSQGVGISAQFRVDKLLHDWTTGDQLILCSFPLVHVLKERVMAEVVAGTSLADCANALIQEALIANAPDNISAIVIGTETDHG